jgi:hypothetical protein
MPGAQNRWQGQPAGLPEIARLGEPPSLRKDEGEAQRRRWTFYEAVKILLRKTGGKMETRRDAEGRLCRVSIVFPGILFYLSLASAAFQSMFLK